MDAKIKLEVLEEEKRKTLHRIEEIKKTLAIMPDDTVLGILCMKAYLKKAVKELSKLEKEMAAISK